MDKNRIVFGITVVLGSLGLQAGEAGAGPTFEVGPERWVYCSKGVSNGADAAFVSNVIDRAAKGGANGLLYAGGLDSYCRWGSARKANFQAIRRHAESKGMEIVPLVWSPGYGSLNGLREDLVETVELRDVPHVARGGRIVFEATEMLEYLNAGFEDFDEKRKVFPYWTTETPGVCSFRDTEVKHSGRQSVRLEPNRDGKHQARVMQHMRVKPFHRYRFSMWIRYKDIPKVFGALRIEVYSDKPAPCGFTGVLVPLQGGGASDWRQVSCDITADETGGLNVYMGTWKLKSGTFWLDDIAIEEIGYREIGGRAAPFAVRDAETGVAYVEGRDYIAPKPEREGLNIRVKKGEKDISFVRPEGSAIPEGRKLLVDAFVPSRNGGKQQRSTCMSDPLVFAAMAQSAAGIREACNPRKWFLSTDEVRNFNSCAHCLAQKTDAAHLIGGYITKAMETIRAVRPDAEVYGWADMFIPTQNGKGEWTDAWKHVPKDFIMCDWSERASNESVGFLSSHGFAVIGSMCKDGAHSLRSGEAWMDRLRTIPNAKGLIFTTWVNDYECLEDFGKLR